MSDEFWDDAVIVAAVMFGLSVLFAVLTVFLAMNGLLP